MKIEEAIDTLTTFSWWLDNIDHCDGNWPCGPDDIIEATKTLAEHVKRTTWQPIETLTTNAEDVFFCRKNGVHVTNAVYISSEKEWVIVSRHPHNDTIHDPAKQFDFWMPAINPPKEGK